MTNEIRNEKINRKKKAQPVTIKEIREEKIIKKKTQSENSTQPDLTQSKYVWVHEFLRLIWIIILPTQNI